MKPDRPSTPPPRRPPVPASATAGAGSAAPARRPPRPAPADNEMAAVVSPPEAPPRRGRPAPPVAPPEALPVAAPPMRGQAVRRRVATPAPDGSVTPAASDYGDQWRGGPRSWLTVENGLYFLFFLTAFVSRFWDLGVKGLHHDESLHAVYSHHYYTGLGYIHSPMMHGPLQFHYIDFFYSLFGATNDTARYASAVCGIFIVMCPFFLRRQMGRWPALVATFLFLVSPSIMYFSRMAREDSITAFTEALLVVGLWRFISERRPWDFYIACAGLALMFTIKETSYIVTAIFGVFLLGLFAWQMGRWMFLTLAGWGVAAGAAALLIIKNSRKIEGIANQDPTQRDIEVFITGLVTHPLIQVEALLFVLFLGVWGFLLWDQRRRVVGAARADLPVAVPEPPRRQAVASAVAVPTVGVETRHLEGAETIPLAMDGSNGHSDEAIYTGEAASTNGTNGTNGTEAVLDEAPVAPPAPRDPGLLLRYQPGSLPYAVGTLLREGSTLWLGLAIIAVIYVGFYTSLFSNLPGLLTGMFGSIGYWLAQQGVARGAQPWFYYALINWIYEPLTMLFFGVAALGFVIKGGSAVVSRLRHGAEPNPYPVVPGATAGWNVGQPANFASMSSFLPLFLLFWTAGVWVAYTIASEKMPWLMIHIVQPSIFLVALFLGGIIAMMFRERAARVAAAAPDEEPQYMTRRGRAVEVPAPQTMGERLAHPASFVPFLSFLGLFLVIALVWLMNIDWQVRRNLPAGMTEEGRYGTWGLMMVLFAGMLVVLTIAYMAWIGPRRVGRWVAIAILFLLTGYEVRSAIQLSYYNSDVPTELAVYVQTSPDVVREVAAINRLSVQLTGGKQMGVMYDSLVSWPFEWYFRDYTRKSFQGNGPAAAPTSDMKVLVLDGGVWNADNKDKRDLLKDYEVTKLPMRWWFPEESYKDDANNPNQGFVPSRWDVKDAQGNYLTKPADSNGKTRVKDVTGQLLGALDTIRYTITTPAEMGKLWKYMIYREPYNALGSTDMSVWVRKDVWPLYNAFKDMDNLPDYDAISR